MNPMTSDAQHLALLIGEVRGDVKALLANQERLSANLAQQQQRIDAEIAAVDARLSKQEGRWIYLAAAVAGIGLASPAAAAQLLAVLQAIFP